MSVTQECLYCLKTFQCQTFLSLGWEIRSWINKYKAELECEKCGENDFRVLDFHHEGNEKEIDIGDAVRLGWSIKRIKKKSINVKFYVVSVIEFYIGKYGT